MRFLTFFLMGLALLMSPFQASAATPIYPELTDWELSNFHKRIDRAIRKEEKRLADLLEAMYGDAFPQGTWVRVQHSQSMLEIKGVLAGKFRNSEMLRSPKVRSALLDILNADSISIQDMARFQDLVERERPLVHGFYEDGEEEADVIEGPIDSTLTPIDEEEPDALIEEIPLSQ